MEGIQGVLLPHRKTFMLTGGSSMAEVLTALFLFAIWTKICADVSSTKMEETAQNLGCILNWCIIRLIILMLKDE